MENVTESIIDKDALEAMELTAEEEYELFQSINMLLMHIAPTLNLERYLRSVVCEVLGVPEDTPDEYLHSSIHDTLPVYIARIRKDYSDKTSIDDFVRFIIDEVRSGR